MSYAQVNQAYTEASVLSATPQQLVVMLYDGAIRFLQQSKVAMEANRSDMSRQRLFQAEKIINELNLSLDMSHGELPAQLRSIYLFCKRHLSEAVIEQDPQRITDVIELLAELRTAWVEAVNQAQV